MKVDEKLVAVLEKLLNPGPVIAGKVRTMTSVCGKPGCKCMRKENPEKHPYHQLSYTKDKKTKTIYVKKADLVQIEKSTENYRELRQATLDLGHEAAALVKTYGVSEAARIMNDSFEKVKGCTVKLKQPPSVVKRLRANRDIWKAKSLDRQSEIEKLKVKVRDLSASRDNWKSKAIQAKTTVKELQAEGDIEKKLLDKIKNS